VKQVLGDAELLNRHKGEFELARVIRELDAENLKDFEQHWQPMLKDRRAEFEDQHAAAEGNVQDWHWDWIGKAMVARAAMGQETFGIECDGHTQGLMLVDFTRFAQLEPHQNRELVYVELLAAAPWNRHRTVPKPQYKGVGRILIATAISLSVEQGFEGRIGLHSLPQSESWYRDVAGFTDVEYDYRKKLRYFEMTATQAATFVEPQDLS
jgi:hypothetical protein